MIDEHSDAGVDDEYDKNYADDEDLEDEGFGDDDLGRDMSLAETERELEEQSEEPGEPEAVEEQDQASTEAVKQNGNSLRAETNRQVRIGGVRMLKVISILIHGCFIDFSDTDPGDVAEERAYHHESHSSHCP